MSLIKVGRTPDFSNNELEKKLSIIQSKSSDEVFVGTLMHGMCVNKALSCIQSNPCLYPDF